MAILEEIAWHLQICNSCFYQVSELWPMGLLLLFVPGLFFFLCVERTVLHDFGISCVSFFIFYMYGMIV